MESPDPDSSSDGESSEESSDQAENTADLLRNARLDLGSVIRQPTTTTATTISTMRVTTITSTTGIKRCRFRT
jgi:hypothetical protein